MTTEPTNYDEDRGSDNYDDDMGDDGVWRGPPLAMTMSRARWERYKVHQVAKKDFIRFLRITGDVGQSATRVIRSDRSMMRYRIEDPDFAAEWDEAQRVADLVLKRRKKDHLPTAVDIRRDTLLQENWPLPDLRLRYQAAKDVIAEGNLDEKTAADTTPRIAITQIVIMEQEKATPNDIPAESEVIE